MSDNFQLFRLSLAKREQADMFPAPDIKTREDFLRHIFSVEHRFEHYAHAFHYVPVPELSQSNGLVGKLGRQVTTEENLPPDEGFAETLHDGWKACVIALDPTDHEDGQKLAIEVNNQIGSPSAILTSFIEAIRLKYPSAPYAINAEPLFDGGSFWEFAAENKGNITKITFDFVVPNGLWTANQDVDEELRALRDSTNAQKVSTTLQSEDGLDTDSEQVVDGVEYAETGSGEIRAKTRNGKIYKSTNVPKKTRLEVDKTDAEPLIIRVARHISKVLGQ